MSDIRLYKKYIFELYGKTNQPQLKLAEPRDLNPVSARATFARASAGELLAGDFNFVVTRGSTRQLYHARVLNYDPVADKVTLHLADEPQSSAFSISRDGIDGKLFIVNPSVELSEPLSKYDNNVMRNIYHQLGLMPAQLPCRTPLTSAPQIAPQIPMELLNDDGDDLLRKFNLLLAENVAYRDILTIQ